MEYEKEIDEVFNQLKENHGELTIGIRKHISKKS